MLFSQFNDRYPPRQSLSPEAEIVSLTLRAQPYLPLQDTLSAIIAFALAQRTGGSFIAQLDNTDPDSLQTAMPRQFFKSLLWLQTMPHEFYELGDYGPYLWRERRPIYQDAAMHLIEQGFAYHCFCHTQPQAAGPFFRRSIRHQVCQSLSYELLCDFLTSGKKYLVRFRVPSHSVEEVENQAALRSPEDFVLLTPQGLPMPYFAHVIDNHLMHVTTQVRRASSQAMMAEETLLYQALGWPIPEQIYVPHIHDPNSPYLFEETSLNQFGDQGYLPEALVNTLTNLIWSHPNGQEIYPFTDFVTGFDYHAALPAEVTFDYELLNRIQEWYSRSRV